MSTNYKLLCRKTKEKFDLGRGCWFELFQGQIPFEISQLFNTADDLKELISLALVDSDYDSDYKNMVGQRIWDWGQGKTLYFGNDCSDIFDEHQEELLLFEYKETGSRYG